MEMILQKNGGQVPQNDGGLVGKPISHYKILEKIGEGGMGEVYLAEDTALDRKVALKFLSPQYTSDPELNKRFRREAKAAAALNHPNIITVYEIGEFEGRVYIAMEYVEGESLRVNIRSGQLEVDSAVDIAMQICEGLNAEHQAGIIHRDIKPENIIVDKSSRVRILDFGLAKLAVETAESIAELKPPKSVKRRSKHWGKNYTDSVVLTNLSSFLGTVAYMSPEQATGKSIDLRTDIWAMGVILYEMMTGEQPFKGELDQAVIYSILNEAPEPVKISQSELQIDFEKIINKCLRKGTSDRYQQVGELIVDLRKVEKKRSLAQSYHIKSEVGANYQKGVYCFENFTPMNLQKSLEYFERAVKEEPEFVQAHIGLARTLVHMAMTSWLPAGEIYPMARASLELASKIEPESAEASALLGLISFLEYDWSGAETKFKEAFTYAPESIIAKDCYAFYLTAFLRHEESINHVRDCLAMAPNTCYYNTRMGWTYCLAGRYDEALAILLEIHELFPELAFPHALISWCYTQKGMHADAMKQCVLSELKGLPKWQNSFSYGRAGKVDEIRKTLEALHEQKLSIHFYVYLSLGEIDSAFEKMHQACEMKEPTLAFVKALPHFDEVRTHPGYLDLLRKMGLDE